MSATTRKTVRARKRHRCAVAHDGSWARACTGWIEPAEEYVRAVCFPGDVNSSDVPWVMRMCSACARGYVGERVEDYVESGGAA